MLKELEEQQIFRTNYKITENDKEIQLGFLFREAEEKRILETNRRQKLGSILPLLRIFLWAWDNRVKHKTWIRLIEFVVITCFVAAALIPILFPGILSGISETN